MSPLTRNLIANLAGQGWSALLNLIAIPLYVRLMGIESYGLIGFYITLQMLMPLFDFGIAPTMNRVMARYSVQPDQADQARDFVRTFEVGYWFIGFAVGVLLMIAAPWIAHNWIKPVSLSIDMVQQVVMAMAVLVFLQFPFNLYQGALLGLQHQVVLNALTIAMATLRVGGVLVVLLLISPAITVFFAWQIFVGGLQVIFASIIVWRRLPPSPQLPRMDVGLVRNSWRFAAGMSGITISALILTQLDKVILSNLLSLEMFGYYSLAGVVAMGLLIVINPVFNVFFPRFSSLVANGDERALCQAYHLGTQLMAALVLPIALTVAMFSFEILELWTGNIETARNVAPIASVLVIGAALNGLMFLPYALQLAHGWTRIGFFVALFLVILLVPAMFYTVTRFGAIGAASVWILLNSLYMLIAVPLTHRRLLKREMRRWLGEDIGLPLLGALAVILPSRLLFADLTLQFATVLLVAIVLIAALATALVMAGQVREWLVKQSERIWSLCLRN